MRLADFIADNTEPILLEWEAFARTLWPGSEPKSVDLRDHGEAILRAMVRDMRSMQTGDEQSIKSKGDGPVGKYRGQIDGESVVHARFRVKAGFSIMAVVAEYRALRASVIRLWRESAPDPDDHDLAELTRFNETIDQSLAEAVHTFTDMVDRSRKLFFAILGHDLRSPLNAILLLTEVLGMTGGLDAGSTESVSHIADSAQTMSKMINDLLDFTSGGVGVMMAITPKTMDLKPLLKDVVREMLTNHPKRPVNLVAEGDLVGEWDAPRLRQVVSNLLSNALHHGSDQAPVHIAVESAALDILLTVQNQGQPIPPDALTTLFDPLVRGTSPEALAKRRPGSIGLGLYIVRQIVLAHGGTIEVTSDAKTGTMFKIRLPRHRVDAGMPAKAPVQPMNLN